MSPRFPRTRKLANPHALLVVDFLYCIMWLSAFAAVANWNGTGKCKGGCTVSKAVVAIGVFLWYVRNICLEICAARSSANVGLQVRMDHLNNNVNLWLGVLQKRRISSRGISSTAQCQHDRSRQGGFLNCSSRRRICPRTQRR
jgi:hypothetical protein